jgi:serine/threonine-protein kinase HipA
VLAQLAFWLLAATDGHAKNFSLRHDTGAAYSLTSLYDVLSAWPIIGHGKNQLAFEKAKLAMALRGRSAHYRLKEITARHWQELAGQTGIPDLWTRMQSFVESVPAAITHVEKRLPRAFPERVYATVRDGVESQVRRFAATCPRG